MKDMITDAWNWMTATVMVRANNDNDVNTNTTLTIDPDPVLLARLELLSDDNRRALEIMTNGERSAKLKLLDEFKERADVRTIDPLIVLLRISNRQLDCKAKAIGILLKVVDTEISRTCTDHDKWLITTGIIRRVLQPVSLYLDCPYDFLQMKAKQLRSEIVESLVGCLEDADSHVKIGIAGLLGEIGTKEAVKALSALSESDEAELRTAANRALESHSFRQQRRSVQSLHR